MARSLLGNLAEEQVVLLDRSKKNKLPFPLKGIVRLIDDKGRTLAFLFDKHVIEEFEEDMAAKDPGFLDSLDKSRRSGRISGESIKAKAGLK
jgi:hypothetical protein